MRVMAPSLARPRIRPRLVILIAYKYACLGVTHMLRRPMLTLVLKPSGLFSLEGRVKDVIPLRPRGSFRYRGRGVSPGTR